MPVTYDITRCVNSSELHSDNEQSISYVIMLGMMFTGGPEITDKNWEAIYSRIHQFELVSGGGMLINESGENFFVTPDMVHRRIGMHTNCPPVSLTQFKTFLHDRSGDEAAKELRKYKESASVGS